MCQPFVRYPHGAKLNAPELLKCCQHARASGLTRAKKTNTLTGYSVILSRSKILQFHKKKQDYYQKAIGVDLLDRILAYTAESDLQYSLNSVESYCFEATTLCLNFGVINQN